MLIYKFRTSPNLQKQIKFLLKYFYFNYDNLNLQAVTKAKRKLVLKLHEEKTKRLAHSYMTSTKNSQGLPITMRKDCRLAERSLSAVVGMAGWGGGGWGEVVAVATDDPLLLLPPLRLWGLLFLCGISTPLSLAELPPLL